MEYTGGRVTKCFTVNLFFKMQTIYYRDILIRYSSLTYKKRFCDKESFRCEKNELFVKICSLTGEFSYGGRATKCLTVNLLFMIQTILRKHILIRYCKLTHKKHFCKKKVVLTVKDDNLFKTNMHNSQSKAKGSLNTE